MERSNLHGDYNPDPRSRREKGVWNGLAAQGGVNERAYGGIEQAYPETITQTRDLGVRRGVWNGLAAREGVKKRAYGGKKQAYTETRTQTPDLGARRGVWNGLAAREGVKMRAYAGNKTPNPPISAREGGSGTGCYSGTRGCRNVPAVEEAGQHGDYNPDPRSRREKGGRI